MQKLAVPLRVVFLPWAQRHDDGESDDGAGEMAAADARASRQDASTLETGSSATAPRQGLVPPSPSRIVPEIPAADRVELDDEALAAAAVVLDVLATRTRRLEAAPSILAEVVDVVSGVAALGDPGAAPELLAA